MTGWWYRRDEVPLRQTIWYSAVGWGGMIGSLMAAGIQGVSLFTRPSNTKADIIAL